MKTYIIKTEEIVVEKAWYSIEAESEEDARVQFMEYGGGEEYNRDYLDTNNIKILGIYEDKGTNC